MWYLYCLLIFTVHADASTGKPITIDEKKVFKGEQQMHISQDVNLDEVAMKKIIGHMLKISSSRAMISFERMTFETKLIFLKSMNIKQYEMFLFDVSEKQWQDMWQRLPEEQKKVIPPTVEIQLKMICACWRALSSGDLFRTPGEKKEADAKDIPFFRNKALGCLKRFKTDDLNDVNMDIKQEVFYQALHNYFQKKKLELLHAL